MDKPNLGSFVVVDIDDEIDQEIKLMRENKRSENITITNEVEKSIHVSKSASKPRHKKRNEELVEREAISTKNDQSDVETYTLSHFISVLEVATYGSDDTTKTLTCLFDGRQIYNPATLDEKVNNKRPRQMLMSHDLQYLLILTSKQYNKVSISYKHLIEGAAAFLGSSDEVRLF